MPERLFSLWKIKFIKEQTSQLETEVDFVPVLAKDNVRRVNHDDGVTIILPNGIRLDIQLTASGADVAELAKHLVVLSC